MSKRAIRFEKKLDGKIIGKIYDALKPEMVRNQKEALIEAVKVEEEVRKVLCEHNILHLPYYMIFAREVLKILRKHRAATAEREIGILLNKWCDRGLHPINLYKVLRLYEGMACKVKIWDGENIATVTPEGFLDIKTHTPDACFTKLYAAAQTNLKIIAPPEGKKIEIISVYASVGQNTTNVGLKFETSGERPFYFHTEKKSAQTGNVICGTGGVNEGVLLSCPPDTFISIGYNITD